MRTLILDIETAPHLVYTWSLREKYINPSNIVEPGGMICFAAKWYDENRVMFLSVHNEGYPAMVETVHALLEQADVVVHYNGKRFDVPRINTEFLNHKLMPPAPYRQIDLYETVRRVFHYPSNRMDYVCKRLGIPGKIKHGGFGLWPACLAGDEKAWRMMKRYNKHDVMMTQDLYEKLLPWLVNSPNAAIYAEPGTDACPKCGETGQLERRGFSYTQVGKFQRYQCRSCGGWSRSGKRVVGVDQRAATS